MNRKGGCVSLGDECLKKYKGRVFPALEAGCRQTCKKEAHWCCNEYERQHQVNARYAGWLIHRKCPESAHETNNNGQGEERSETEKDPRNDHGHGYLLCVWRAGYLIYTSFL